jgi:hypothetical protein
VAPVVTSQAGMPVEEVAMTHGTDTEALAAAIAETVFFHALDADDREKLEKLLIAFAAEIKRSAIEP